MDGVHPGVPPRLDALALDFLVLVGSQPEDFVQPNAIPVAARTIL
jgi:hypothetical protein